MTKIKDIPIQDRPIERLLQYGVESVSNEELLAILLRTGNKTQSSKELATTILSHVKQISELKEMSYETLCKIPGIGKSKATLLLAAFELGNRIGRSVETLSGKKLNQARLIYEYYRGILSNKKQEHVYCLYLDSKKTIIKEKLLFLGTINYSMIHPREIFKEAYLTSATAIICVHNHPTGDVTPSKDDYNMTYNLMQAGEMLGIPLLDHIIIGKEKYYSFFENGDMDLKQMRNR